MRAIIARTHCRGCVPILDGWSANRKLSVNWRNISIALTDQKPKRAMARDCQLLPRVRPKVQSLGAIGRCLWSAHCRRSGCILG
jgi:hypothetical protein